MNAALHSAVGPVERILAAAAGKSVPAPLRAGRRVVGDALWLCPCVPEARYASYS